MKLKKPSAPVAVVRAPKAPPKHTGKNVPTKGQKSGPGYLGH